MSLSITSLHELCSLWGLGEVEAKKLSERATLLETENGEKFILKLKASIENAAKEIELLKQVGKVLNVQFPLLSNNEEYIVTYKNKNYCLYHYIEGTELTAKVVITSELPPKLLGNSLAILHKAMNIPELHVNFPSKVLYEQVYNWAIHEISSLSENDQITYIFSELHLELKRRIECLPTQLIHRDAHIYNFIFREDEFSGVIDFDLVEQNVRILDLCYCSTSVLSEIFSDEQLRESWIKFVGNLFKHYDHENPLLEMELEAAWYVMLCIQAIFMAYFVKYPSIFEINKAMFIWIYENKGKLENELAQIKLNTLDKGKN